MMSERYSRQQLFWGEAAQKELAAKHVAVIGVGAIGATAADLLVRAGIGRLTLVDRDYVELSNLHRQSLYTVADAEEAYPKALAAKKHLASVNPEVIIDAHVQDADQGFFQSLAAEHVDLIIDATDNFETRLLLNDCAHYYKIPWIYGACVGAQSICYFIEPEKTPCLHCLVDQIPLDGPTCDTVGILAPAAQITANLQVAEALKFLTGHTDKLHRNVISVNIWDFHIAELSLQDCRNLSCSTCGDARTYPFMQRTQQTDFAVLCGRQTVQIRPKQRTLDFDAWITHLQQRLVLLKRNPYLASFDVEGYKVVVFKEGRLLIHGMTDPTQAKKLYYRYFTM